VKISGIDKKKSLDSSDSYSAFKIDVHYGMEDWTLWKRYKEFSKLHDQLKERFGESKLPLFPQTRSLIDLAITRKDSKYLEQRRLQLEQYLNLLLSDSQIFQTGEVRSFLEPEHIRKNSVENFLLPPPSGTIRIPKAIQLDKDNNSKDQTPIIEPIIDDSGGSVELEDISKIKPIIKPKDICFVREILKDIKDNLEYICRFREDLKEKDPFQRLKLLEEKEIKIEQSLDILKKERTTIDQITKLKDIADNIELQSYFITCIQQIDKAIEWQSSIEAKIIESTVDCTSSRIEKLELRAETLVLEGMNGKYDGSSKSQLCEDIKNELNSMSSKDNVSSDSNNNHLKRLIVIENYIKDNTQKSQT